MPSKKREKLQQKNPLQKNKIIIKTELEKMFGFFLQNSS